MALVSAYARRGATIPMILDDVLVNIDGQRAKAAAELLCEFSRNGYQILMFTCHDHMRDMFHLLGADVRILPQHRDVVESNAAPVVYQGDQYVQPRVYRDPEPVLQRAILEEVVTENRIPVEYVEYASSNVVIDPDEYDPELEYELSAVATDQQAEQRLRQELVYFSPNLPAPIDISGNEDIWWETGAKVNR